MLSTNSLFFKNTLEGEFKEKDGTVKIRDADARWFQIYVTYLYSGKLATIEEPTAAPNSEHGSLSNPASASKTSAHATAMALEWQSLNKCLILADRLQDDGFHNATMDCYLETIVSEDHNGASVYPAISVIAEAYNSLPHNSPAFLFFVDVIAEYGHASWINLTSASTLPSEFWCAVSKGLLECMAGGQETTYPMRGPQPMSREIKGEVNMRMWMSRCRYHKHPSTD